MQEKSASVGALSDAFGARATPPSDQSGLRPWSQRERRGRFPRLFSQRRRRRALRPAASASGAAAGLDAARSAVSATVAAISTARADGSRQRFAARQRAPSGLGSVSLGSAALAARLSSARDVSARLPGSLARSSRFQHAALRSRRRSARRSASRQRHAQRRGAAGGRRRVARRLRRRGRRLIGGERRVRSTPASRGGEPSTSVERAVVDADRRAEQKVGCAGARGGERERRRARRCRQQRQKRLRAAFFSCNGRKATIQFKQ